MTNQPINLVAARAALAQEILKTLDHSAAGSLLHRSGKDLTAYEANQSLGTPGGIEVEVINAGGLRRGRYPSGHSIFRSPQPDGWDQVTRANLKGKPVVIHSQDELIRLNAVEQLTSIDTRWTLTPEELELANLLRRYEGHYSGTVTEFQKVDDSAPFWIYKSKPGDAKAGIFTPPRGLLRRQERLSVYEAMQRLTEPEPQPIILRTPQGNFSVSTVDELKSHAQLNA